MPFRCHTCGQIHKDLPSMGTDKPDQWWDVPKKERRKRIKLTTDTCIIDGKHCFIRGVLEIPVKRRREPFTFGVWVSQKPENFRTYVTHPGSADIGPFFGWLCTGINYYPVETLLLKTRAHFRGGGLRPTIELEPTDHPLAVDQREGITLAKAWEIVHQYEKLA